MTIEQYLEKVGRFAGSEYGRLVRSQFADSKGDSELAMLVAPSREEFEELKKGVAIMTEGEKGEAEKLGDRQIEKIAAEAGIDAANFAIFINGYTLYCRRLSRLNSDSDAARKC